MKYNENQVCPVAPEFTIFLADKSSIIQWYDTESGERISKPEWVTEEVEFLLEKWLRHTSKLKKYQRVLSNWSESTVKMRLGGTYFTKEDLESSIEDYKEGVQNLLNKLREILGL